MTSGTVGRALQDSRGCLTEAGLAALERAPVGRAPAELVAHLTGCDRCQRRVLFGGRAGAGPASQALGPRGSRPRTNAPPLWRSFAITAAALFLALAALGIARCWVPV